MTPQKALEQYIQITGYTQEEAGDHLGFTREHINRILNGLVPKNADFFVSAVKFKIQNFRGKEWDKL